MPSVLKIQLFVPEIRMVNVTLDAIGAPRNGPFVTVITSPSVYPVPGVFIAIPANPLPPSPTFTVKPVPVPPVVARLLP